MTEILRGIQLAEFAKDVVTFPLQLRQMKLLHAALGVGIPLFFFGIPSLDSGLGDLLRVYLLTGVSVTATHYLTSGSA